MPAPSSGQPKKFFRKVTRLDSDEICLDADMIRLLIAIDETKEIGQIARELKMDAATLKAALVRLLQINLVEPVDGRIDTGEPPLEPEFLKAFQAQLTRSVGPMAPLLIEEAAADLQLNVNRITRDQAAELIRLVSEEIPDPDSSTQFKKDMLDWIRK
jgi:predicted ArsR family transcriptional regulator